MKDLVFHPLFEFDMQTLHFFSVLGRTLFTAQQFEGKCKSINVFPQIVKQIALQGSLSLENPEFVKSIDQVWRRSLGKNIHVLKKLGVIPGEVADIFKMAVKARNEIAHEVAIDVNDSVNYDAETRILYILELVEKIAEADKLVSILIHNLNKESLPSVEYLKIYTGKVKAWVSEETFED